jgi:hypothetical protein
MYLRRTHEFRIEHQRLGPVFELLSFSFDQNE